MRRTSSSPILRALMKEKMPAVTKSGIPSRNGISKKKNGGCGGYVSDITQLPI